MNKRVRSACPICVDDRAGEIAASLFKQGLRKTALTFGFKIAHMRRHRKHLPGAIAAKREEIIQEAQTINDATPLVERALRLVREAEHLVASARADYDWTTLIQALREARACIRFVAELRDERPRSPALQVAVGVNVGSNPSSVSEQALDRQIAQRLNELTRGFDPSEIERLKLLAASTNDDSTPE